VKVKELNAVSLKLPDGGEAVLVQDGDSWNGILAFVCVSPRELAGEKVITMPGKGFGGFPHRFTRIFAVMGDHTVLLASDLIGEVMQKLDAAERSAA